MVRTNETYIQVDIDDPNFQRVFAELNPPFPAMEIKYLDHVNDEITAHTRKGRLTLSKEKC
ncbi:hypothetical protein Pmar_PMAR004215 [Perkinsus marinus ATCC 50983]|uniref:Uncharacterized protein n=1 Tax=Perkinsus marinus (strain ATCC 50983 / TXsc) TaxID=423536 RepID=C5LPM2_PERM5|nr:hypothetical protein Pmar_PMAR004215 [Perkinsus marinus ATCC 50983]EER01342.1 hypothetical protein Pmar_PMAR004215 [Perkinsus marinus ATCC 50983]|eukprot:XP_002768624.1 hypothetical protein Pmar_PMAR004215 [Perkinsus marinus ATCC 50983]